MLEVTDTLGYKLNGSYYRLSLVLAMPVQCHFMRSQHLDHIVYAVKFYYTTSGTFSIVSLFFFIS